MTKRDIVIAVSAESRMSQKEVRRIIDRFLECIRLLINDGEIIDLSEFGKFMIVKRRGRMMIRFKVARALKQIVSVIPIKYPNINLQV